MTQIKCMVEECTFNSGCLCNAGGVEVCSCGTKHVSTADQTACRTFKKKGC